MRSQPPTDCRCWPTDSPETEGQTWTFEHIPYNLYGIFMEFLIVRKTAGKEKKNHGPQDKHLLEELLKCVWKTRFTTGRRVLFESVPEKKKITHEWVYLSEAETLRLFAVDQSPSHTFHTGLWDRTSAGALGVFLRSPLNRPPLSCRKRRKQRHNQRHNQTQVSSFYKERKSE